MGRRYEDMLRIREILGKRYEKGAGKSAFCVLTDEKGSTTLTSGSWQKMFSAAMDSLANVFVEILKPGVDYDAFVEAVLSAMTKAFRKDLETKIRWKYGKPDISADMPDPEERLRKALLGEE